MSTEFWIAQSFNGISYGALLFLLASGLSLIFGVMRIVNLAHGSYFMLGGYVGLTVALRTRVFALALPGRRGGHRAGRASAWSASSCVGCSGQVLGQVLMTIGFALIFQDLALLIWGGDPYTVPMPGAPERHHAPGRRGVPDLPHLHRGRGRRGRPRPSGWCSIARASAR